MHWIRERWIPIFVLAVLVFAITLNAHIQSQNYGEVSTAQDTREKLPSGIASVDAVIGDLVETPPTVDSQEKID